MKLAIGFITYNKNTAKYLPYFLPSIFKQSEKDFVIFCQDNSEQEENDNKKYIQKKYLDINFAWSGGNIGFSRAYNKIIKKAIDIGAKYFLMLNPDMILDSNMIANLLSEIKKDDKIGAVQPKILKWNFDNISDNLGKTDVIDSYGLYITKEHRFSDLRQGEKDDSLAQVREVFGFTGAAVLLNLKAVKDIAYKFNGREEYFDELMFMYKEDCDLSYRLQLAGWKVKFIPQAVCYHDRTASPKGESTFKIMLNRKNKSKQVKKWAFLNHWILILKYLKLPYSPKIKIKTWYYQLKSVIFILLFEQYLLKEFLTLIKNRKKIKNKRDNLKIRVDVKEIEKIMID